ncbi:SKI/DACH domain-containing protein 1 [Lepisosteus oculatus]|uniref:SKI/DACH domain-containing protein 1 n=1 Tax=Lepisosteus oculatus TaxID=7918 RepID=UPI0037160CB8
MDYSCELGEGGFQTGRQEIDGISMGYLRVNGRKMFALAQVFSDLFRDIPRTTVMKRMEVLNIRSRRCDIQELRTLKAMQSVPVRAVKCSLIAKEDLEALCLACQALSPSQRRKRRKGRKAEPGTRVPPATLRANICPSGVLASRALTADPAAAARGSTAERAQLQRRGHRSQPAHSFSHSKAARDSLLPGTGGTHPRNYEKVVKGPSFFSLTGVNGLLPSGIVNTFHSSSLHSAIAGNECRVTGLPLYLKSKRPCYSNSDGYAKKHNSAPLLLHDKNLNFAQGHARASTGPAKRGRCTQGTSAGYSSDSESSLDFEKDSDFGSSYQSASTESSDEDDHVDGRSVLSSSSEEGSSSDTDSSSACSGDSVQSTRYRQAALPAPASRLHLPGSRDAGPELIPASSAASGVCATTPPAPAPLLDVKIKTEPFLPDPALLFPQDKDQGWPGYNPATSPQSPGFRRAAATVKAEPVAAGSGSLAELAGYCARRGPLSVCADGLRQSPQQKSPFLRPEGGSRTALPLLKNGNSLHKGGPDNGPPSGPSAQAQSRAGDAGLRGSPLRGGPALAEPPGRSSVDTERISVASDPQGSREPGRDTFEPLIRTSKLWCYAKGFNFDGKNGGYASSVSRVPKSKGGRRQSRRGGGRGGGLLEGCPSLQPRGRPPLSRKAFKVNGLERNLKGSRPPKRSEADRQQETSKRDRSAHGDRKGNAARAAAASSCRRRAAAGSGPAAPDRPFSLLGSFPCPPSLVVGEDGDLCPAYSLCSRNGSPHKEAHPPCRYWQLGGNTVPVPPSHRFRGYRLESGD